MHYFQKFNLVAIMSINLIPCGSVSASAETLEISEKLKAVGENLMTEKFDERARSRCDGDYELVSRAIEGKWVRSHIKCANQTYRLANSETVKTTSQPIPVAAPKLEQEIDFPRVTFAKLIFSIGMLPTCSGEQLDKGHVYCGEKYAAGLALGEDFGSILKLNHYNLHRAANAPEVNGNAIKWQKEELFATSATVSQQHKFLGMKIGTGLGYFGGILNQRQWIEYPFPQSDDTISKERGYAWGLATELSLERTFVDSAVGDFNVGLSASGLFPSSTSNPRIESKYWVLPSLEFTWVLGLQKRQRPT